MSRITGAFRGADGPLFIGYTVAGDPDPEESVRIAETVLDAGADILELGVPFSDPVADGPVIQRAGIRALAAGTTPPGVFGMVREIRKHSEKPIVLLTYYNPVYRRGLDRFSREAAAAGVDGILAVDLPLEEADRARECARKHDLDQILLAAPTTGDQRLSRIVNAASGFLYLVSRTGVTGTREDLPPDLRRLIGRVKARGSVPVAVGFGISQPDHVRACTAAGADAVIVGSGIVGLVERHLADPAAMHEVIHAYIRRMKGALGDKKE
ncbi:MAG: tryptophan synthase subunit alpha [Methanomicrobiales archaeon]|nr:tryptophan synthase subunit alpha [Methanomicrobiales archaeon]